jgi:NaMN:DMB phosphoribosyltransferase
VVREGVGAGGEMTLALYAHMNNKINKQTTTTKKKQRTWDRSQESTL